MVAEMPKPIEMPVNAALRAREPGYGWGHQGSHEISCNFQVPSMRIKVSARELMELLAGRRTTAQANDLHGWLDPEDQKTLGRIENPFELRLRAGQLPLAISVIKTGTGRPNTRLAPRIGSSVAASERSERPGNSSSVTFSGESEWAKIMASHKRKRAAQ